MEEIWKDIEGFEGWYQVSNTGKVKSIKRRIIDGRIIKGIMLKQEADKQGYLRVTLHRNGRNYKRQVHRLVASAFIPNPNNLPVINHIDENPNNNIDKKLEWCTIKYNVNYGHRAIKYAEKTHGELRYNHKLTDDDVRKIRAEYQYGIKGRGTEALAAKYGVHRMTIKALITRKTWKHI